MADQKLGDVAGKYQRLSLPRLPGYQRVPGKAGRYRGPGGEEISNRQYKTAQREKYAGVRVTQEEYAKLRKSLHMPNTLTIYQEFQISYAHEKKFERLSDVRKDDRFKEWWESWKIVRKQKGSRAQERRRIILKKVGMLKRIAGKWVYVNPG